MHRLSKRLKALEELASSKEQITLIDWGSGLYYNKEWFDTLEALQERYPQLESVDVIRIVWE